MAKVYDCVDGSVQSMCLIEITKIMESLKGQHDVELFCLSHSFIIFPSLFI